jgi:hypothetical protein
MQNGLRYRVWASRAIAEPAAGYRRHSAISCTIHLDNLPRRQTVFIQISDAAGEFLPGVILFLTPNLRAAQKDGLFNNS